MALSVNSETSATSATSAEAAKCWVDYYLRNRNDKGPIEALFAQNHRTLAQRTASHLNNTNELTETIVGSSFGNMMMVPWGQGTMQVGERVLHPYLRPGKSRGLYHLQDPTPR